VSDLKGSSININFPWLVTLVFVVLKLVGEISWSWWWVFSPIWVPLLLLLTILGLVLVAKVIVSKW
jgi:hypothetical protein